jgi:hypothetical protein
MSERIFNLFVFVDNDIIRDLGVSVHEIEGSDSEKIAFLQDRVNIDHEKAIRVSVPSRYLINNSITNETIVALKYDKFRMLSRMNLRMELFEEIFQSFNASVTPLFCVTPIINGQIKIDELEEIQAINTQSLQEIKSIEFCYSDYLIKYVSEEGFDLPRLLNDDYLSAIKLLYDNGHYVSSLKLLMSFIDTVAYIEFDDVRGNFQSWLDTYTNLTSMKISSAELWEMRNSLLHMTNSDSRKVLKGEVTRLMFYVGALTKGWPDKSDEAKYFELMSLITTIALGVSRWAESYNISSSKFDFFIDRYDRVISDSRYQTIRIE